jgi:hypothetical protein
MLDVKVVDQLFRHYQISLIENLSTEECPKAAEVRFSKALMPRKSSKM